MARFKHYDLNQTKMIPLSYADHVLEGSFEYALNDVVGEHLDLSVFEHRVVIAAGEATGANAYVADRDYRKREPAFAGVSRYKASGKKERGLQRKREREARESTGSKLFTVKDFVYDEANARCSCPAGLELYRSGKDMLFNGYPVGGWGRPTTVERKRADALASRVARRATRKAV